MRAATIVLRVSAFPESLSIASGPTHQWLTLLSAGPTPYRYILARQPLSRRPRGRKGARSFFALPAILLRVNDRRGRPGCRRAGAVRLEGHSQNGGLGLLRCRCSSRAAHSFRRHGEV